MTKTLEQWAKEVCPHFIHSYERSKVPFENLLKGTKLFYYRPTGGSLLIVTSDILTNENEIRYVETAFFYKQDQKHTSIYQNHPDRSAWYLNVCILSDEEIEKIYHHTRDQQKKWENDRFGQIVHD